MLKNKDTKTVFSGNVGRGQRGFTMVELIAVFGILVVLMGLVFVAIMQVRINAEQTEVDGSAREIYVAAQNRLIMAQEQGLLKMVADTSKGTKEIIAGTDGTAATAGVTDTGDVYYYIYNADNPTVNNPDADPTSAIGIMLPFASVSEDLRTGGDWIIRYQPATAKVLDVFFAKRPSEFRGHEFTDAEYKNLLKDYRGDSSEASGKRRDYNGNTIGWFGADLGIATLELQAPGVTVLNGDKLQVNVLDSTQNATWLGDYNSSLQTGEVEADYQLRLIVAGKSSGARMYYDLHPRGQCDTGSASPNYSVTLDDVTKYVSSMSMQIVEAPFSTICENMKMYYAAQYSAGPNTEGVPAVDFIPGENLEIYAVATSSTTLATVAESPHLTVNSLFADDPTAVNALFNAGALNPYRAYISSFRHLSNLAKSVSNFEYKFASEPGASVYDSVEAIQLTDLDWSKFITAPTTASIYKASGEHSAPGTFLPVTPGYPLTYDGSYKDKMHAIINLNVSGYFAASATESTDYQYAGMFGDLANGSKVRNLELVDCSATTTLAGSSAGLLAGNAPNATIENVLARDNMQTIDNAAKGNAAIPVRVQAVTAGGIVGTIASGEVKGCAASVRVAASGGPAGGLVGNAGNATIENSYSGGHTKDGKYVTTNADSYDVQSTSGNAGGLVGTTNVTITNCYSTCSVKGTGVENSNVLVGGLAGNAGGAIRGSYAVGAVGGEHANKGALAGNRATFDSSKKSHYYAIVNGDLPACGVGVEVNGQEVNTDPSGVAKIDENAQSFDNFATLNENAYPYDPVLAEKYMTQGTDPGVKRTTKYLFKTVADLNNWNESEVAVAPYFLKSHYGDWPMYETFVINTKS